MKMIIKSIIALMAIICISHVSYGQAASSKGSLDIVDTAKNRPTTPRVAVNGKNGVLSFWNLNHWSAINGGGGDGILNAGLTMPSAFSVSGSPISGAGGTFAITGAGSSSQFINGTGSLETKNWWRDGGNSGTTGSNFIGTTDNIPFRIKVNNLQVALFDTLRHGISLGYNAMPNSTNTFGTVPNVAIGREALFSNTTGYGNYAIGFQSLANTTTGQGNIAIGHQSGQITSTGTYNTYIGTHSGQAALPTANYNVGVGWYSNFGTGGSNNTSIGTRANQANGNNTTAVGFYARNGDGTGGVGAFNGIYSTAVGYQSLLTVKDDTSYLALGDRTVISNNLKNAVAIGSQAMTTASNRMTLGSISGINGATASMKVGIGTTAADSTLHIVGGFKYVNGSQGANKILTSDATGGAIWSINSPSLSSITAATGNNNISNGNTFHTWDWNTFTSGGSTGSFNLASTSTAKGTGSQFFTVKTSGILSTSNVISYASTIANTNTASGTSTNIALGLLASGAADNVALYIEGGSFDIGKAASQTGIINFRGITSGKVSLQSAAAAGTWTMTLPTDAGTDGYILKTNGFGVTSWIAPGSGSGDLLAANNLSELTPTASTARSNIGAASPADILQVIADSSFEVLNTINADVDMVEVLSSTLMRSRGVENSTTTTVDTTSNGNLRTNVIGGPPTPQTLTDGATITWNAALGYNAQVTLGATGRTLSITNPISGMYYTIRIIQDGGGSKTITTWPTNTKWIGAAAPTLTTTGSAYDIVTFYYDGTNYYANYGLNYN